MAVLLQENSNHFFIATTFESKGKMGGFQCLLPLRHAIITSKPELGCDKEEESAGGHPHLRRHPV